MEVPVWFVLQSAVVARAEAPPSVAVSWKKDAVSLLVEAPAGQKIAPDAPMHLNLGWSAGELSLDAPGALLHAPVTVADLRGGPVEGTLELGLCTLDGTICRPTSWTLAGAVGEGAKGEAALTVAPPRDEEERPFGPDADDAGVEAALARAKAEGKAVLLDFSAVWCPPCNLLAAEVLHAEPAAAELDGYEVVVLDADHRSSFAWKQRYDVGGYPTVVVVDGEGVEKTRLVGYPGREDTLDWLAGAATSSDAAELAAGPAAATPERAAELAWTLVTSGEDELAEAWLARAREGSGHSPELHLTSLAAGGAAEDVDWLLAHAPGRVVEALPAAGHLVDQDPAALRRLLEAAARVAKGTEQADVLELSSRLSPEGPERTALLAGAAAVVAASMTGDAEADKGLVTWLADLHEQAGNPERAVELLERSVATWPDEPTFDLALSPLLLRLGRPEEALVSAERAVAHAWDDNRLRAVAAKARALNALHRGAEAQAVARAELEAQPAPPEGTNPRTERYRERLRKLADGEGEQGG